MSNEAGSPQRASEQIARLLLAAAAVCFMLVCNFATLLSDLSRYPMRYVLPLWLLLTVASTGLQCYLIYYPIWRVLRPSPQDGPTRLHRGLELVALVAAAPLINDFLLRSLVTALRLGPLLPWTTIASATGSAIALLAGGFFVVRFLVRPKRRR